MEGWRQGSLAQRKRRKTDQRWAKRRRKKKERRREVETHEYQAIWFIPKRSSIRKIPIQRKRNSNSWWERARAKGKGSDFFQEETGSAIKTLWSVPH